MLLYRMQPQLLQVVSVFSISNLFRLMIINRVYLYSGRISNSRFKTQNKVNLCLYVAFISLLGLPNLVFVGLELLWSDN